MYNGLRRSYCAGKILFVYDGITNGFANARGRFVMVANSLRYRHPQYLFDACAGVAVGDVCPSVLRCDVLNATSAARLSNTRRSGCTVRRLHGFGWNPSIMPAPRDVAANRRDLAYVATSARGFGQNRRLHCRNKAFLPTSTTPGALLHTELLLLDRRFQVLERLSILAGSANAGRARGIDARLLFADGRMSMTLTNHWDPKGHWLARLFVSFDSPSRPRAWLHSRDAGTIAGYGLDGVAGKPLVAPRNSGIFVAPDTGAILGELVDVSPYIIVQPRSGSPIQRSAPLSFGEELHNSIHPLWIAELGLYLAVGHIHHRNGWVRTGASREAKRHADAPFEYGYAYRQVLLTIHPGTFDVVRFSRELCFSSLEAGAQPSPECEGIQFVMSAFRDRVRAGDGPPLIGLSYGVQDCEAALLTMTLERLNELLEFAHEAEDPARNRTKGR